MHSGCLFVVQYKATRFLEEAFMVRGGRRVSSKLSSPRRRNHFVNKWWVILVKRHKKILFIWGVFVIVAVSLEWIVTTYSYYWFPMKEALMNDFVSDLFTAQYTIAVLTFTIFPLLLSSWEKKKHLGFTTKDILEFEKWTFPVIIIVQFGNILVTLIFYAKNEINSVGTLFVFTLGVSLWLAIIICRHLFDKEYSKILVKKEAQRLQQEGDREQIRKFAEIPHKEVAKAFLDDESNREGKMTEYLQLMGQLAQGYGDGFRLVTLREIVHRGNEGQSLELFKTISKQADIHEERKVMLAYMVLYLYFWHNKNNDYCLEKKARKIFTECKELNVKRKQAKEGLDELKKIMNCLEKNEKGFEVVRNTVEEHLYPEGGWETQKEILREIDVLHGIIDFLYFGNLVHDQDEIKKFIDWLYGEDGITS